MTRYYFVSYIYKEKSGVAFKHCLMKLIDNRTLTDISQELQKTNNCEQLPVILNLRDLSKTEYKMLVGEQ